MCKISYFSNILHAKDNIAPDTIEQISEDNCNQVYSKTQRVMFHKFIS